MSAMENIKDEETRPLAPKRRVAEAYSTNDRQSKLKKYSFWIFAFIAFVIFSAGSGRGESRRQRRAKKLRAKAETMPEAEVQRLKEISKRAELNDKYAQLNDAHAAFEGSGDGALGNDMLDEDDIEREVGRVADDVMLAEEDEVESKESMLLSSVQSMGESVTSYLMQVFGYEDDSLDDDDTAMTDTSADIELSEEQLDVIAKKISDRLAVDVKRDFRKKADDIAEGKVSEIDMVVAEDKGLRVSAQEIGRDIKEAEKMVLEDLKDEIDETANRVKDDIPEKVKKIRNDVIEEVTGKKLDIIEQKKRAKAEKRKELAKKFQEMQAKQLDDANNKFQYDKFKAEAKSQKYPPMKKVQKPPVGDSEDDVDEKPRRRKPPSGDEDDAESTDKKKLKKPPSGDEDDAESTDKKKLKSKSRKKSRSKYDDEVSKGSGGKDKVELSSGRRNKNLSEDE